MENTKKHYKPESERRVRVAGTVSPENAKHIENLAIQLGASFSWALDKVIESHRTENQNKQAIYGQEGEK